MIVQKLWQDIMEMLYGSFDSIIEDLFEPLFKAVGLDFLFYSACILIVTAIMRLIIFPLVGGMVGSSPVFGAVSSIGSIRKKNKQQKNNKGGKGK